jgi:hypothetical protein
MNLSTQNDGFLWWNSTVLQICTKVTADFAPFVDKWYINVKNGKDLLELLAVPHIAWQSQYHCNSLNHRIKSLSLQPNALLKRHKTSQWIRDSWQLRHIDESVIERESIIWIVVPLQQCSQLHSIPARIVNAGHAKVIYSLFWRHHHTFLLQ